MAPVWQLDILLVCERKQETKPDRGETPQKIKKYSIVFICQYFQQKWQNIHEVHKQSIS